MIYGIDISKYNIVDDWNAVKASGKKFVFIRLGWINSDGSISKDERFEEHYKNARSGALAIGVKFIGDKLTLSPSEVKKIEVAKNAKPTDMKKTISNEAKYLLADLGADLGSDDSSESPDDLPF